MANTDGPWIRFYASDWLAGTRGMTAAETGVYITLIATMYERAAPIPRDDSRLARVCGLPTRNFSMILDRLIETDKIVVDDMQNLWGRKVDMEVRNRSARAERGRLAAQAKHEQKQQPNSAKAQRKHPPSTSQTVPRARASEPEPDSKDIESLEAKQQRKRGSRLPADWSIPNEWGKWACDEFGIAPGKVRAEADRFRDYWIAQPGQKGVKLDWQATWRNWCRTAFGSKSAPASRQPVETVSQAARALREEIENAERQGDARSDRTIDGRISGTGERRRPPALEHLSDGD